jgi:hypothetical protein
VTLNAARPFVAVMQADAELTGGIVAIGFVVMGSSAPSPFARWFLLGALLLGDGWRSCPGATRKQS